MNERRWAFVAALVLAGLGLAATGLRAWDMARRPVSHGQSVWRLRYDLVAQSLPAGARLRVALPGDTDRARVLRQSFSYPGLVMDLVRDRQTGMVEAMVVVPRAADEARFSAEFDIRVGEPGRPPVAEGKALPAAERAHYLREEPRIQVHQPALERIAAALPFGRAREVVNRVFDLCAEQIALDSQGPTDAVGALTQGVGNTLGRARALVALLRARMIPARVVVGFDLDHAGEVGTHHWVEAHVGGLWLPLDPQKGFSGELPPSYVPARRDSTMVVLSSPLVERETDFHLERIEPAPAAGARAGDWKDLVNLARLSIGMQHTLTVILLLPVAALVTAFFRNVIGIQTFGTFTPGLLALSFVYADWRTGLFVLVVILVLGLASRRLLDRLRLLLVPRLSLLLTLVVMLMVLAVSLLDLLGLTPSARAVLLPMVILTMMIERFHMTADQDGMRNALQTLAGTFAVGAACLGVMLWGPLGWWLLRFPETHLLTAALLIMLGRYTGYRLTELWRFRALMRHAPPEAKE
jgi:transglutaminase-like putative cysteine protease